MTRGELERIAMKKGFVRWTRSGRIERLHYTPAGAVMAENIISGCWNFIMRHEENRCVEVVLNDTVRLGDMM